MPTTHETGRSRRRVEGYTLAFDACSVGISFCLWEGNEVRLRWSAAHGEALAEDLPCLLNDKIAEKLTEETSKGGGFSYRSLRRICFVRGPGSYTGLRASLSVARGLRVACRGLDMYSITSIEAGLQAADACREGVGGGYVLSLVESFRGAWYGQAFVRGKPLGEPWGEPLGEPLGEPWGEVRVLGEEELRLWVLELLEAGGGKKLCLCGGGVERALGVLGSFPDGLLVAGGVGDAWEFSRKLVAGEDALYARGEAALQPVYMRAPV